MTHDSVTAVYLRMMHEQLSDWLGCYGEELTDEGYDSLLAIDEGMQRVIKWIGGDANGS